VAIVNRTQGSSGGGGGYVDFMPAPPNGFTLLPFTYQLDATYVPTTYIEGPWYLSTHGTPAFADQKATTAAFGIGKLNDGIVAVSTGIDTNNDSLMVGLGNSTTTPRLRFVFDLASSLQPSEIRFYGFQTSGPGIYGPTEILVEQSDDNSTWTTLEDRTGLAQGTAIGIWEARFTPAAPHRYWRASFYNSNSGNWVLVTEARFLK